MASAEVLSFLIKKGVLKIDLVNIQLEFCLHVSRCRR